MQRGFAPGLQKECTRLATASDKVYQLLAHGRWFSPGTPASSTTKTGRHDIAEILLKVALNTIKSINQAIVINYILKTKNNFFRYMFIVVMVPRPPPLCSNNNSVISPFMTYNRVTRVTRPVPHVEQGLLTLPEHMSSPPAFNGVRLVRSLIFL
jgi:hypothetical protein